MTTMTVGEVAEAYTAAVSRGDFVRLAELIHPDATFDGTVTRPVAGREAFVQGFRNLSPVTVRTDVHRMVIDGDRAALLYDLVTDTAAGAVQCSEFLTVSDGQVLASTLVFDWRQWPDVLAEIGRRVAPSPGTDAVRPDDG